MPQNQITEAIAESVDIESLEPLSDSETEFVRCIMQEGISASDAYRRSHNTDDLSQNSIWNYACVLKGSAKVQNWIAALTAASLHSGVLQQNQFISDMLALGQRAESAGNYGAAVNAKANAGKVAGLYVERYEDITQRNLTVDQLISMVKQLVGQDIADQISNRLGLIDKPAIEHLPGKQLEKQPDKVTASNAAN